MLHNLIKEYKENGYNIVEREQDWSTMLKVIKKKSKDWKKKICI